MQPCEQKDNIIHIQNDLQNHQSWRKATTTQLTDIQVALATLNERLKSSDKAHTDDLEYKLQKFDDHVKDGNAFRLGLIFTMIGLIGTMASGFIAYGKVESKVEFLYEQKNSQPHP